MKNGCMEVSKTLSKDVHVVKQVDEVVKGEGDICFSKTRNCTEQ